MLSLVRWEYSGAPTEGQTYKYAETIIDLIPSGYPLKDWEYIDYWRRDSEIHGSSGYVRGNYKGSEREGGDLCQERWA